jgi:hypothetical protein
MLTNVMLYWLTGAADSSARIYYERPHADYWGTPPEPSTTTAWADFPHDNFTPAARRGVDEQDCAVDAVRARRGTSPPWSSRNRWWVA